MVDNLHTLTNIDPNTIEIDLQKLTGQERYAEAIELTTQLINKYPQDCKLLALRADLYDSLGHRGSLQDHKLAIADYTAIINIEPENIKVLEERALRYTDIKDFKNAILDWSRLIALNPQESSYFSCRGCCYWSSEQYEEALSDQSMALYLDPQCTSDHHYECRGYIFEELEKYDKAASDYINCILLDSECTSCHESLFELSKKLKVTSNSLADADTSLIANEPLAKILDAAVHGSVNAQYRLGEIYEQGIDVKVNNTTAFLWYQCAAEAELPEAENKVGYFYSKGLGVKKDNQKAVEWYQRAADKGLPKAKCNLAIHYIAGEYLKRDYTKALTLFKESAQSQYPLAEYLLGKMYYLGFAGSISYSEALDWFSKSISHGKKDAHQYLGEMYFHGRGVPRDIHLALAHLEIASQSQSDSEIPLLQWINHLKLEDGTLINSGKVINFPQKCLDEILGTIVIGTREELMLHLHLQRDIHCFSLPQFPSYLALGKVFVPETMSSCLKFEDGTLENLARMLRQSIENISIITLAYTNANDDHLQYIAMFPSLEVLDISWTEIKGRGLATLASLSQLSQLYMCTSESKDEDFEYLSKLQNLKLLDLSRITKITSPSVGRGDEVEYTEEDWEAEERVNQPNWGDGGLKYICKLAQLQELSLDNVNTITDNGISMIKNLQQLEKLNLSRTGITDTGLKHLYSLPQLRVLNLSGANITDGSIKFIEKLPNLVELNILCTKISKEGIKYIKQLPNLLSVKVSDSDSKEEEST
jgi:TPR repeat protein